MRGTSKGGGGGRRSGILQHYSMNTSAIENAQMKNHFRSKNLALKC